MIRLVRFSVRHPGLVLATVALLTLAACLLIPRVRLQLDAWSLVPAGDPVLQASDNAARLFGLQDVVVIGVVNEDSGIYAPDTLRRIARLSRALSEVDGIAGESRISLASLSAPAMKDGRVTSYDLLPRGRDPDAKTAEQVHADVERLGLRMACSSARMAGPRPLLRQPGLADSRKQERKPATEARRRH